MGYSDLWAGASRKGAETRPLAEIYRTAAPTTATGPDRRRLAANVVGPFFLAVDTLARQVSGAKISVWERGNKAAGERTELPFDDPLVEIFETPNPAETTIEWLYRIGQQWATTGAALVWSYRQPGDVVPTEHYVLPTGTAFPQPPSAEYPYGSYMVTPYGAWSGAGATARVPAQDVARIYRPHAMMPFEAYAAAAALADTTDVLRAIDEGRRVSINEGVAVDYVLEAASGIDMPSEPELRRYLETIKALHSGPQAWRNVHMPMPGTKLSRTTTTPKEMDFTESYSQSLAVFLAGFGLNEAVCMLHGDLNYSVLNASMQAFHAMTLQPLCDLIAAVLTRAIIWPNVGRKYCLGLAAPLVKDRALEEMAVANDMMAGIRLNREMRRFRGLDSLGESWEDERAFGGGKAGGSDPKALTGTEQHNPRVEAARPRKASDREAKAEALASALDRAELLRA